MQEKVACTIREYSLIEPGQIVVLGLSGGPDSVALLHVLLFLAPSMEFTLCAAHLNHGIRGEAADADEQFVIDLCEFLGVPLYRERIDVPAEAAKLGMGLEQAGRELRYDFLRRAKKHFEADRIAVAHHMNDQAESILLHLTRGCGLVGLTGMQPRRQDIIRPLLFLRRAEILGYLNAEGLAYCMDESNLALSSTRNRFRLELIPYIEEHINPGIVSTLCAMAELLLADERYLSEQAEAETAKIARDGGYLRTPLLALPSPIRARVIRAALWNAGAPANIERVHVDMVVSLLSARTGAKLKLSGVDVWNEYDLVCFGRMEPAETDFCVTLNPEGVTETPLGCFESAYIALPTDIEYDKNVALLDADKLPASLVLRSRRQGDRFFPLGAPGKKKLKSFFIDRKVPRNARILPILTCGGEGPGASEVIFVPGFGIGEPYKLRENTKRVLRVVYRDIKLYQN